MLVLTLNESGNIEHFLLPSGANSTLCVSSSYKDGGYIVKIDGMSISTAVAQSLSSYNRQLIPSVDIIDGRIKIKFSNGNILKPSPFKLTIFTHDTLSIDPQALKLPSTPQVFKSPSTPQVFKPQFNTIRI